MRFIYFRFENFKGIDVLEVDLRKSPLANVYPLVGLNESGKTTILEAINFFEYKPQSIDGLDLEGTKIQDLHEAIPINSRDNFTGYISIEAGLEFDDEDIDLIRKKLTKSLALYSLEIRRTISFTQKYYFQDSVYTKAKNQKIWNHEFLARTSKGQRKAKKLANEDALKAFDLIKDRIPSIMYFPNFLFEFPNRIYLNEEITDPKDVFYRNIIQDILDSLENNLIIKTHLVDRILSNDENHKRHLLSVISKMNKKLTEVIFKSWNRIFGKQINDKEIALIYGNDDKGVYLEFNIRDSSDTYRVDERSLGFRWFFVFLLFTQFRMYHNSRKNVFLLLDEPASNLHPSAQMQLLNSFGKLSWVMYTTHSHYLINPAWLENTFVVKNEAMDYENEEEYNSKKTKISIHKYREFATKYPNQSNYFQPILEVLNYAPSNLDLIPDIVMTEGKSDYYCLNYYQKIAKPRSKTLSILPGTSASNLENVISLYLGWGRNFIILLDSDGEGKKQLVRYSELFGKAIENRIFLYSDIEKSWNAHGIEKIFADSDKLTIQGECYPSEINFSKGLFNKSIQELFVTRKSLPLAAETSQNFDLIFSFLESKIEEASKLVV